ncbi:LysR substrate-binding domain-containing protein [Roseobacter sp. HKCCA0434]|uniref:LysR substrate-binding domain-containing protein n=1 Tax=Roseobacter sp. HKCCA0434 TaxID=3079297 RepID=UPI002905AA64|nr:LysR substrate-binding domain-containing protein [Roseobacter sp. HKCCA0434]
MPRAEKPKIPRDLTLSGLKFSHLRLLAALRDTDQISAAAQQVGMTQPTASRILGQLELMLGTPIHTRQSRGILLTEAGALLAGQASAMLRGLERTRQEIAQIAEGTRGHVRIGSVTGPSLDLLLPTLREMRVAYPDIETSVHIDTSDRLSDALLSDEIDLYIGRIPDGADARPFLIDMIGPEPISLVVRLEHPLVGKPDVTLDDCLAYDWVMQPPGGLLRRTAENYLLEHGLPLPRRVLGTPSILFTLAHVNETNAVSPLARAVAEFFIARGSLGSRLSILPLATDMAVSDYGIVRRSGEEPTPTALLVLNLLREHRNRDARSH